MARRSVLLAALFLAGAPGIARAQYFGQNKVQYTTFDWQVIRTEHFEIHYYGDMRPAALDAARMSERSYARLSRILQHEWIARKPLILYASWSDFAQTNVTSGDIGEGTGGFTDFYRNRMVLPFTGSYDDFEHVLEHEMVHAFQYDVFSRGHPGQGIATISAINPSLWFMEGMAEYLSIGPVDPHTAMWMRDAALNGRMPNLEQLTYDPSFFPYRFGHALWAYVGQKWGDETVGAVLQASLSGGVERAFSRVLGLSLEALIDEWREAVQNTYLPQVPALERPRQLGRAILTQRTVRGTYHVSPQISPDGRHVAYLSERNFIFVDLYLADIDSRRVTKLVSSALNPDFESLRFINSTGAWSADGTEYVFVSKAGGQDVLNIMDVRRRRVSQRLELGFAGIANPSFSPNGQQLVFTGMRGGWSDLYVVDRGTMDLRRLTSDRYADLMAQWSPDGRTIAFATDRGGRTDFDVLRFGNLQLALYWLDGDSVQLLDHMDEGKNINPVWSPDGQSLAFVSSRTGAMNVFLYDLAQREVYQLTNGYTGVAGITDLSPAISWAREADRLVATFYENGDYNVYLLENPRGMRRAPFRPDPAGAIILANASAQPLRRDFTEAALARRGLPAIPGLPAPAPAVNTALGAPAPSTSAGPPPTGAPQIPQSIYRGSAGMRPSDTLAAAPTGGAPPLSVAQMLDSVMLALPDTSEFVEMGYRPRYTADLVSRPTIGYARDNFGRGFFGGAAVQLTDLLGDNIVSIAGAVNGRIQEAQLYVAYLNLSRRLNWMVGGAQDVYYFYGQSSFDQIPGGPDVVTQRLNRWISRQLFAQANYPINRFKRWELRTYLVNLAQASLTQVTEYDPLTGQFLGAFDEVTEQGSASYALPSIAYVHDNSLFGFTSSFIGSRYRFEVGRSIGEYAYTQVLADWRNYKMLGIPLFTFATRLTMVGRFGRDEELFPLFLGTPDRVRGYTYNSFINRECGPTGSIDACRDLDRLIGSRMALASAEVRFPLLRQAALGFLPIGLPPIEGVLFFDAGLAWSGGNTVTWGRPDQASNVDRRGPITSYGAGLRLNLFGFAIMSLDYAIPRSRPDRKGYWIVSLQPPF